MNGERLDSEDSIGVVWREILKGIFSTLGRLRALANCLRSDSGRYHHENVARILGVQGADRALRTVHGFVWDDWLGGSLEQQQADLLLHIHDFAEDIETLLAAWRDSQAFLTLVPDSANAEQRAFFVSNLSILLALLRNQYCLSRPRVFPKAENATMEQTLQILREDYTNPVLSLRGLGKKLGISERHLGRLFKVCTDQSFRQYLCEFRMDKAVTLLLHSAQDVKAVAGMVGYGDPNYFSRDFRESMGCTPTEFRMKSRVLRKGIVGGQPLALAAARF